MIQRVFYIVLLRCLCLSEKKNLIAIIDLICNYRRNFPAPHNSRRVQLLSLQPALAPPHLGPGPAPAEARLGHRAVDPVKVVTHILVHAQHFLIILKYLKYFVHQIIFYFEPRLVRCSRARKCCIASDSDYLPSRYKLLTVTSKTQFMQ